MVERMNAERISATRGEGSIHEGGGSCCRRPDVGDS
jgi:hypothetical protein